MRTEKHIAAFRLNGRKSPGAATSEGKARIVADNLKFGVYVESPRSGVAAACFTSPWESP